MVALIISIQIQILFMFHWWWSSSSTCVMWFVMCTSFDVLKTCCMAVGSLHQHSFSFSAVHVYASSWLFSLCTSLWFTFLCSCTYLTHSVEYYSWKHWQWELMDDANHCNDPNTKEKGQRKQYVPSNIWCLPTWLCIVCVYVKGHWFGTVPHPAKLLLFFPSFF